VKLLNPTARVISKASEDFPQTPVSVPGVWHDSAVVNADEFGIFQGSND